MSLKKAPLSIFSGVILLALLGTMSSTAPVIASPLTVPDQVSTQKKKILTALKKKDYNVAMIHAKSLASIGGAKAAEALFDIGLKVNVTKIFNGIAELLSTMTSEEELEFFSKLSKKTVEARLIYLTDILKQMKHPKAATILGNMGKSKSIKVLTAVVSALSTNRSRESVQVLLDLLERLEKSRDRGLIYQEVRDVLFDITGHDFETLADWKKWWEPVKDTYKPDAKTDGKTGVARKSRDSAPEFAGRKIFSNNVVFVIDTSGTMQYVMKDDIPGLGIADGSDAAGRVKEPDQKITPENERLARYWTRLEMAKRELLKALRAFGSKARINVMEFHKMVILFQKKLGTASLKLKKNFGLRVKKMQPSRIPGTNTLDALKRAFALDGRLSAIYFLSDGLPSADGKKNDDPLPLLDEIESLNRFRKIKVHTFGYDPVSISTGQASGELVRANEFLQKLAERTGGTFTLLKVTGEKPPPDFK